MLNLIQRSLCFRKFGSADGQVFQKELGTASGVAGVGVDGEMFDDLRAERALGDEAEFVGAGSGSEVVDHRAFALQAEAASGRKLADRFVREIVGAIGGVERHAGVGHF